MTKTIIFSRFTALSSFRNRLQLLTLLSILVYASCSCSNDVATKIEPIVQTKLDSVEMYLKTILDTEKMNSSLKILLIPNAGCTGCIAQAILDVRDDKIQDKDSTFVVFYRVNDLKRLRQLLGTKFNEDNIVIDKSDAAAKYNIDSPYPTTYKIQSGNVIAEQQY